MNARGESRRLVAGVGRAHGDRVAASRERSGEAPDQARDSPVRPCVSRVRRDVQDPQRTHQIGVVSADIRSVPILKSTDRFVIGGVLAASAGALYVNALRNPFIYDDYHTVVAN